MAAAPACKIGRFAAPSGIADVFTMPMLEGHYGQVRLDVRPFRIILNSDVVGPRRDISLVHEMLHIFMRLHKMDAFPHDKLHDIACFAYQEVIPTLRRAWEIDRQRLGAAGGTASPEGRTVPGSSDAAIFGSR